MRVFQRYGVRLDVLIVAVGLLLFLLALMFVIRTDEPMDWVSGMVVVLPLALAVYLWVASGRVGVKGGIVDLDGKNEIHQALIKASVEAEELDRKFRQMFYSMQEGVFLHDVIYDAHGQAVNYRITQANPASGRILGIEPGQAVGKLATDLYQTEEAPYLDVFARVAETQQPLSMELFFEPMGINFLVSVFSSARGQFGTIFLDITRMKSYEEELAAQNEEYASLNEELHQINEQIYNDKLKLEASERSLKLSQQVASLGSFWIEISSGRWTSSEMLDELFGIDESHLRNWEGWWQLVDEGFRAQMQQMFQPDTLVADGSLTVECQMVHQKSGRLIWVQVIGQPDISAKGALTAVYGTIQDITRRKAYETDILQAREEAEAVSAQLRIAENRLKLKLDGLLSPDFSVEEFSLTEIIDLELLQSLQDGFAKVTGVASVITDVNGVPLTTPSNFSGVCRLIRNTEKGRNNCFRSDRTIGLRAAAEKKVVYEKCHSCGFIDAGAPIMVAGKQLGVWMIGQSSIGNVGEERIRAYSMEIGADTHQMLTEFRKMRNMSLEQFEDIVRFLWLISQEVSNLAFNNLKLAKSVEEHKIYEAEIRKAKERAEENGVLLKETNKSLEEMVYIASHDLQVPLVSMEGYATELLESYAMKLDEEGQFCLTRLQANARRMHKLVLSLLDISRLNTHKKAYETFSMQGVAGKIVHDLSLIIEQKSIRIKIGVLPELYADKDRIETVFRNMVVNSINYEAREIEIGHDGDVFFVRDDGLGIPVDQLERIFRPGERLKRNDAEGVGMGLTFCRKVVEQHKGNIWAWSEGENRGTTMFVKLT